MRKRVASLTFAALTTAAAVVEPLVYERFEGAFAGAAHGGIRFSAEVVGYGGTVAANKLCGEFDGQPGTFVSYAPRKVATTEFTVQAFVRLAAAPDFDMIAADWNEVGDQRAWALVVLPGGALRFDISPDGRFHGGNTLKTRPRLLQAGVWYHVAAVSRGDLSLLYLNGCEVGRLTRPRPGIFAAGDGTLEIGNAEGYATGDPRPFHGWLDEVCITPAALGPGEFLRTREPMPEIEAQAPRPAFELPFVATTREAALSWQQEARTRLLALVAKQEPRHDSDAVPLDVRVEDPQDEGAYTLWRLSFEGNRRERGRRTALLAVPKGTGPFPGVLALHGHSGNAELVFDPTTLYMGFADRFARGGYVVLAPSLPHSSYAATTLWDLFRCVDILAARPDVDRERLGVAGLSMGGEWAMWIAACDPRLKAVVVSGWMCTTEGTLSVPNCECWVLPGFVELMDVCDVHLAIAPRALVLESALGDPCFPIRYSCEGYQRIRAGYRVFGAEDAVVQDIWSAGHEWHGALAYPAIDKALGGRAAAAGR